MNPPTNLLKAKVGFEASIKLGLVLEEDTKMQLETRLLLEELRDQLADTFYDEYCTFRDFEIGM